MILKNLYRIWATRDRFMAFSNKKIVNEKILQIKSLLIELENEINKGRSEANKKD